MQINIFNRIFEYIRITEQRNEPKAVENIVDIDRFINKDINLFPLNGPLKSCDFKGRELKIACYKKEIEALQQSHIPETETVDNHDTSDGTCDIKLKLDDVINNFEKQSINLKKHIGIIQKQEIGQSSGHEQFNNDTDACLEECNTKAAKMIQVTKKFNV